MRIFLLAIVFLLVIIIGSVGTIYYISNEAEDLHKELVQIEKDIDEENWEKSQAGYNHFKERWDMVDHRWSMLVDHTEIDYINMYLGELEAYIKTKNRLDALAKLSTLKSLIKHIPDKEYPSLKNIF